jgi:hypothetical protein
MTATSGITTLSVAHEVMKAHFAGMVPTVSLSETVHQLVHSGEINIHVRQVHGDVVALLRTYHRGVAAEHILKIRKALEVSKGNELHSPDLLRLPSPEEIYVNPKATFEAIEAAYRSTGSEQEQTMEGAGNSSNNSASIPPWEDDEESEDE